MDYIKKKEKRGTAMNQAALDPPLAFIEPLWYRYRHHERRWPGKACFFHDICQRLERNLLLLDYPQGLTPELEAALEMKWSEREMKIADLFYVDNERSYKNRRKTKREKKKEAEEMEELRQGIMKQFQEHLEFAERAHTPLKVWKINKGLKVDNLVDLLSGRGKRDYLIKFKGKKMEKVKIGHLHLDTKYVLLLFLFLPNKVLEPLDCNSNFMADFEDIYSAYNPKGEFEVVFVALGNNKDAFHAIFSRMPWLAIPHQDQQGRELFQTEFAIPDSPIADAVLFAQDGTVLLDCPGSYFRSYGAECFPFTEERIKEVTSPVILEADALLDDLLLKRRIPSLNELLGDKVVNSEGNQVCTSLLNGKTVGLHYFEISDLGFQRTAKLLEIWKSLKDMPDKNLEIVFINEVSANPSYAKAVFENEFGSTIPWYTLLPVDCRKLSCVFKNNGRFGPRDSHMNAGYFIILRPDNYQHLSYFGFEILEKFGTDAYPFTLERAVELVKSKQRKKLVLSQLLSPLAPLRRGGSPSDKEEDTTVSNLLGKRVLLLFATHSCYGSGSFMPALKRMYLEKKGTNDDFEIIYTSLDCDESPSSFPRCIQEMPWLVHSFVPDFAVSLFKKVYKLCPHLPAIAAFGRDGHLETKESNLAFKDDWNSKYPFIQADMAEVVCRELINKHKWDLESFYFPNN